MSSHWSGHFTTPPAHVIPSLCSFAAALRHVRRDKGHVKVSAGPRAFLSLPLWSPPGLIKDPQASGCKSELHGIFCKHLHGRAGAKLPGSEQQLLAAAKGEQEPGSAPPLVHLNSFAASSPAGGND